ncbi:MAG: putative porin [Bacterioplanes sp.]|nr:putative porin [Bacterioplanes sp.]
MKKTTLAIAVASSFAFAGMAQAQDYQVEVGASYLDMDGDETILMLDATYYLEQVSTSAKPLAEVAFLGRNSNLSLSFSNYDEADVNGFSFDGEFWFDDFYVAVGYDDVDGDSDISARLGYMLQDGALVYVGIDDEEFADENTYILGAKYVANLGGNFVNLEGELLTNDGDNAIALAADYFVNHEMSIGLRVEESDVSGVDTTWGVGARYFFMPNMSAELEYTTQDSANTIGFRLAARF